MLEYVYIDSKEGMVKIMCNQSSLPDFSVMGVTQEEYEERIEEYQDYLKAKKAYEISLAKYEELFYGNIDLFMEHFDEIMNEPKYANIMMPQILYCTMYAMLSDKGITLGEQLSIYKNEEYYTATCPKCGGKLYLIHFGYSPLSGSVSAKHRCFGECKEKFSYKTDNKIVVGCSGVHLANIRKKYSSIKSDAAPVHIAELLKHLGKEVEYIDSFYDDNSINKSETKKGQKMIALCHIYDHGVFDIEKIEKIKQIESNIIVPQEAWTLGFAAQILSQNALFFGELPDKFKRNKEFLRDLINNTDWIPEIGMISPKVLTAEACIKAINAYPHKRRRLLRLVPEHLLKEVEEETQIPFVNEMIGINACPYKRKRLLKLVPEHLLKEVEEETQIPFVNEMIGIISAYRYSLSDEINERKHRMMLNELQALGLGHRTCTTIWEDVNGVRHTDKNILVTIRYGETVGCKLSFEEFSKIIDALSKADYTASGAKLPQATHHQDVYIVKNAGERASLAYTFHDSPARTLGEMIVNELAEKLVKVKLIFANIAAQNAFSKIIKSTGFAKNDETNCSGPQRGTTETIRKLRKDLISRS